MGIETILIGAGLAVAAGGTYSSMKAQKKAAKAQREANDFQRKQADLAAMRQKRDAIRSARLARATAENNAASSGVLDTSSSIGGLGSISSQLNDSLSFLDQWNRYSDQATEAIGRSYHYQYKAQKASRIAGIGMAVATNADVITGKINEIFGKKEEAPSAN